MRNSYNNSAERAIRPAVLWKKNSFGSQSENGSIFVARMLTVVSSLRSQNRSVLDFIRETITAHRQLLIFEITIIEQFFY
jgi:transposase